MDAATCRFIRFYCAKWKAKTLFQVLLQYRAARYQDLFNFSQQVHLFNQQVVCSLQKCNNNIGLDLVDRHAQPVGWLGEMKPSVLKMPFKLIDIPFFDTSYMCDPLSNPGVALDKEEDWDAPFRWRENVSLKITNAMNETKISIAKPYSANIKSQSTLHKPIEPLINLPYSRDPYEPIRRLSTASVEYDPRVEHHHSKRNLPPPPPDHQNKKETKGYKDHNYNCTKSSSYAAPKSGNRVNPIAELQTIGRKATSEVSQEDDPPFNFQAMLRKTNTNRGSMKRTADSFRNLSFKNRGYSHDNLVYDSRNNSLRKHKSFDSNQMQKMQLAPGIFMEGVVADL